MIRALLGGTYDPVHSGHQALVARLLDGGLAQQVTVVPARISPHKDANQAPDADRLAMVRLAFADEPLVTVDPRELSRPGPSYTFDTLGELIAEYPDDQWRLVIGADHLASFGTWHRAKELLESATLLVFARDGRAGPLPEGIPADRVELIPDFDVPLSSTRIRAMLAAGRDPADLPAAVLAHIRARGLYRH